MDNLFQRAKILLVFELLNSYNIIEVVILGGTDEDNDCKGSEKSYR